MDTAAVAPEIAVVDHAPSFRELLEIFLSDEGFRVTSLSLDDTPPDQIVAHPATLYIVGLTPGDHDDLELLERLHRRRPRAPVVVLATSAELMERTRSQPERYAGDRFLRLPVNLEDLLREVRALVPPAETTAASETGDGR